MTWRELSISPCRTPVHLEPTFLESNGALRRGEHYPSVHTSVAAAPLAATSSATQSIATHTHAAASSQGLALFALLRL